MAFVLPAPSLMLVAVEAFSNLVSAVLVLLPVPATPEPWSNGLLLLVLPARLLSSSQELWNYLDFHFVLDSIFCQGFRRDDWFVASGEVELPQAFQWDLRGLVYYFLEDVVVCTLPHPRAQTYCPDEDGDLLPTLQFHHLQYFVWGWKFLHLDLLFLDSWCLGFVVLTVEATYYSAFASSLAVLHRALTPVLLLLLRDFVQFFPVVVLDAVLVAQLHPSLAPLILPCEAFTLVDFGLPILVLFTPEFTD